jgi:hypothetical protein
VHTQGFLSNGLFVNGTEVNGFISNGTEVNGLWTNGTEVNGLWTNGTNLNGVELNGLAENGTTLNGVALKGTTLQAVTAGGQTVSGVDLVGAKLTGVLSSGRTVELTIGGFATENGLSYYWLEAAGQSICGEGGRGLFVNGVWDTTGARHDSLLIGGNEVSVSFSCTNGAIAKCVRFGYDPSTVGPDLHQSCTRMVRADYCGSGVSFTKNGTLIDVFDTHGIQQPTRGDASLVFEAAWTTSGAACVNRTRYEAFSTSGAPVLPSCWDKLPKCTSWGEAEQHGAVLGDASRIQSVTFCE